MRWRQFFTPVKSIDAVEAKDYLNRTAGDAFTLLDVRQPGEYEAEHLPGAKLIPLPELGARLAELDADKPTMVYCAIGGRSRIAAQVLAAKGFREVMNLSGGIKAWNSQKAVGPEDQGLSLFSGRESPEETLLRIFNEYRRLSGAAVSREEFARNVVAPAMEGGLTTQDYLERYQPDLEVPEEVISLAMAIEAQALDLYQRAADRAGTGESGAVLTQIANEERAHLEQLGALFATH